MDSAIIDHSERKDVVPTPTVFTNARHFNVLGGQFNSISGGVNHITNYCAPKPSEFRAIPIGDVNLRHELCMAPSSSIAFREQVNVAVRKLYLARIEGGKTDMAVAIHHGEKAEKIWLEEIEKYSGIRHPNILQIYAVAQTSKLYATIFHDGLIPLHEFRKWHSNSVISTAYLEVTMGKQFKDVEDYWAIFDKRLQYGSYTLWIRASSKQLCVDLSPGNETPIPYPDSKFPHPTIKLLASGKDQEPTLLAGIGLEEFPDIIDHYSWAYTSYPLARDSSIQLGAVDFHHESLPRNTNTSPAESSVIAELISFNDCPVLDLGWRNYNSDRGTRVENEWTRFSTADLPTDYIALARTILMGRSTNWSFFTTWLMQANYIFAKLGIKTNFEAFKLIKNVEYSLSWCAPEALGNGALPCIGAIKSDAYLFLCPRTSLLGKDSSEFRYPESPVYYWSLDPTGNARLSYDDRLSLGLPELELHITYAGYFWSEAVYGAVREFQKAKGFDPYTPEAARHLGIPIYGLPRDICPLWLQIFKLPLVRNFLGHVPFWRKVRWATHMGLKKCQILRRICMYLSLGLAFLLGCVYFISDGTK